MTTGDAHARQAAHLVLRAVVRPSGPPTNAAKTVPTPRGFKYTPSRCGQPHWSQISRICRLTFRCCQCAKMPAEPFALRSLDFVTGQRRQTSRNRSARRDVGVSAGGDDRGGLWARRPGAAGPPPPLPVSPGRRPGPSTACPPTRRFFPCWKIWGANFRCEPKIIHAPVCAFTAVNSRCRAPAKVLKRWRYRLPANAAAARLIIFIAYNLPANNCSSTVRAARTANSCKLWQQIPPDARPTGGACSSHLQRG